MIAFLGLQLGLQLLVWQKCEEGGQVGRREWRMKQPRHLLLTRNEASRMPEEAQRAYSVLHMWAWRTLVQECPEISWACRPFWPLPGH
eukprot:jgi/Botrbrau1/17333/Bobra.0015s0079.1